MGILHKTLFTVRIGSRQFQPGVAPTLATIFLVYAFISLGFWQLDRASYKQNIHDTLESRQNLYPVSVNGAPTEKADRLFLPVTLNGYFDSQHQLLLDNRIVKHKVGYNVFSPFLMDNGLWILINRGWIRQGKTRADIPDINIINEQTQLTGLLASPPPHGILLEETYLIEDWPAVVQNIEMSYLSEKLQRPFYDMVLHLDKESPYIMYRDPLPLNIDNSRNYGYAFQWFSFAVVLLIIYFVVNTHRIKNHE